MILFICLVLLCIEHIRRFKPINLGIITSIVLVVVLLMIVIVPSSYWVRQETITNVETDDSIISRKSYISVGWDAIKENPIIGSGPGTFQEIYAGTGYAYERMLKMGKGTGLKRYAHNTYLETFVGRGALGLLFFLTILLIALRNFHVARKQFLLKEQIEMASIVGAYRISFVSMLIYFLFISDFDHHYLWISIAASQVALRLSKGLPEKD